LPKEIPAYAGMTASIYFLYFKEILKHLIKFKIISCFFSNSRFKEKCYSKSGKSMSISPLI